MRGETALMAHIARAENQVSAARQSWNATSPSGCAECAQALERAVSELESACAAAAEGPAPESARARIEQLRRELDLFGRLVDSATAFCRGLEWIAAGTEAAHSDLRG